LRVQRLRRRALEVGGGVVPDHLGRGRTRDSLLDLAPLAGHVAPLTHAASQDPRLAGCSVSPLTSPWKPARPGCPAPRSAPPGPPRATAAAGAPRSRAPPAGSKRP